MPRRMNGRRELFKFAPARRCRFDPPEEKSMKRVSVLAFVLAIATFAPPALAMGSDSTPPPAPKPPAPRTEPAPRSDTGYSEAERAVKAKQYEDAIKKLEA